MAAKNQNQSNDTSPNLIWPSNDRLFVPRDGEKNPIPPGNQPQSPLGKGANAGPEKLPDIGSFGDPGNIPPTPPEGPGPKFIVAMVLASFGLWYDNESGHITSIIKGIIKLFKKENPPETAASPKEEPVLPKEPSFSEIPSKEVEK